MTECEWKLYSKEAYTQMRPYIPGQDLSGVSVSDEDSPKLGDMIARNASNHNDKWLVAKEYFDDSYVPVPDHPIMEKQSLHERMRTAKCGNIYSYVAKLESRLNECETHKAPNQVEDNTPELLDVVRDCVNFLADLNSAPPFLSEDWALRAKSLHKRAYTAHSKAKSHADTLKGE